MGALGALSLLRGLEASVQDAASSRSVLGSEVHCDEETAELLLLIGFDPLNSTAERDKTLNPTTERHKIVPHVDSEQVLPLISEERPNPDVSSNSVVCLTSTEGLEEIHFPRSGNSGRNLFPVGVRRCIDDTGSCSGSEIWTEVVLDSILEQSVLHTEQERDNEESTNLSWCECPESKWINKLDLTAVLGFRDR